MEYNVKRGLFLRFSFLSPNKYYLSVIQAMESSSVWKSALLLLHCLSIIFSPSLCPLFMVVERFIFVLLFFLSFLHGKRCNVKGIHSPPFYFLSPGQLLGGESFFLFFVLQYHDKSFSRFVFPGKLRPVWLKTSLLAYSLYFFSNMVQLSYGIFRSLNFFPFSVLPFLFVLNEVYICIGIMYSLKGASLYGFNCLYIRYAILHSR